MWLAHRTRLELCLYSVHTCSCRNYLLWRSVPQDQLSSRINFLTDMETSYTKPRLLSDAWNREDIYCCCDELSYSHSHCPCDNCNGKAVSRPTEYRHWRDATLNTNIIAHIDGDGDDDNSMNQGDRDGHSEEGCGDGDGGSAEGGGDGDGDNGGGGGGDGDGDNGGGGDGDGGGDGESVGGDSDGDGDDGGSGGDKVKNDIKAVTKAFQLNDKVNGSQQNFLAYLSMGRIYTMKVICF